MPSTTPKSKYIISLSILIYFWYSTLLTKSILRYSVAKVQVLNFGFMFPFIKSVSNFTIGEYHNSSSLYSQNFITKSFLLLCAMYLQNVGDHGSPQLSVNVKLLNNCYSVAIVINNRKIQFLCDWIWTNNVYNNLL